MRYFRTGIIGALFLISFLALPVVYEQSAATHLDSVQVDLWPDYDQPAVLVLVTAMIPAESELPAVVSIKIPAVAGEPNAVATIGDDGGMFTAEYQMQTDGDSSLVMLQTTERKIRIEYYYPYTRSGNKINFDYKWLGGASVDDLIILFREPAGAVGVQPGADFVDIGLLNDGQRYHQWDAGPVEPDDVLSAAFSYQAAGDMAAGDVEQGKKFDAVPVLFAGGGLVVGGLAGWYLAKRRPAIKFAVKKVRNPVSTKPAAFCPGCGAGIKQGDSFCRQCGKKVA